MHVAAFRDIGNKPADIMAVFDRRLAIGQIAERNFVPDRHVIIDDKMKVGVVFGDDAQHLGSGLEAFNDNNADVVPFVMDKQMRNTHFAIYSYALLVVPERPISGWRQMIQSLI